MKYSQRSRTSAPMSRTSLATRIIARPRRNASALFLSALMLVSVFAVLPAGAHGVLPTASASYGAHAATVAKSPIASTAPLGYHLGHPLLPLNAQVVARDGRKAPFTLASHSGTPTLADRPLSHTPLTSTSSNFDVLGSGFSYGRAIAQSGSNNQPLTTATSNWYGVFNGTGGNPCVLNMASPSPYM